MKKILFLFVILMMMTVAMAAQAEVKAGSFSITPVVGGYFFENNQDLKDSVIGGLRAGYNVTENLGLEAFASFLKTEIKDVPGEPWQDVYGYGLEGLYHFFPDSHFVPFLALGIGGIHYDGTSITSSEDKLTVDYGAGIKIFLTENVALRADVRHVMPLDDNYNDLLCTVGVHFAFGGKKKEIVEAQVEEQPAPVTIVDSDKDGVPDDLDKCPETPAGVAVDKDGCPLDSDKDGVYDYLDKCPGSPAGVTVDKDGCPLDSDQDGVYD
ncbi:MAG: outer membrane beta-barrel domain-containing protein, partial [Smithella sp.]